MYLSIVNIRKNEATQALVEAIIVAVLGMGGEIFYTTKRLISSISL